MDFQNTEVWGFKNALRGMRNPLESWQCNDSTETEIGPNDLKLAQKLINAGPEHRKFLRQIFVSVDITAPLYWWKEADKYQIGVTTNSCSTMHKLTSKPITLDCFEIGDINRSLLFDPQTDFSVEYNLIPFLENLRLNYLDYSNLAKEESPKKKECQQIAKMYWKELIRWLPESWLQMRTVAMNYENLYSIIRQRQNHKLNEWSGKDDPNLANFISWAKTLPYAQELLFYGLEVRA